MRNRFQKARITDVAARAGVSPTTVSRALNRRFDSMSPETRERVEQAVAELGYVPNSFAQGLKTGRTGQLGVILSNIAHPYWAAVLSGVEAACRRRAYRVLIGTVGDSVDVETQYLGVLTKQVDGLLVNPTGDDWEAIHALVESAYPIVLLDRTLPGLDCNVVAMDNVAGARLATRHLLELGHRRIAYVSYEPHNLSNRQERLRGYLDAMAEAGVEVETGWVQYVGSVWGDGVEKTRALFAKRRGRPTAVFAASGLLNLEVLAGLKQAGLRVPEDVSVVGFDDSPWDPLLDPPLTTVATPAHKLGAVAAKLAIQAVTNPGSRASQVRLEAKLAVRESTREA